MHARCRHNKFLIDIKSPIVKNRYLTVTQIFFFLLSVEEREQRKRMSSKASKKGYQGDDPMDVKVIAFFSVFALLLSGFPTKLIRFGLRTSQNYQTSDIIISGASYHLDEEFEKLAFSFVVAFASFGVLLYVMSTMTTLSLSRLHYFSVISYLLDIKRLT